MRSYYLIPIVSAIMPVTYGILSAQGVHQVEGSRAAESFTFLHFYIPALYCNWLFTMKAQHE